MAKFEDYSRVAFNDESELVDLWPALMDQSMLVIGWRVSPFNGVPQVQVRLDLPDPAEGSVMWFDESELVLVASVNEPVEFVDPAPVVPAPADAGEL